jgi:hypothetical protein
LRTRFDRSLERPTISHQRNAMVAPVVFDYCKREHHIFGFRRASTSRICLLHIPLSRHYYCIAIYMIDPTIPTSYEISRCRHDMRRIGTNDIIYSLGEPDCSLSLLFRSIRTTLRIQSPIGNECPGSLSTPPLRLAFSRQGYRIGVRKGSRTEGVSSRRRERYWSGQNYFPT